VNRKGRFSGQKVGRSGTQLPLNTRNGPLVTQISEAICFPATFAQGSTGNLIWGRIKVAPFEYQALNGGNQIFTVFNILLPKVVEIVEFCKVS
jgi:hypothetical protein